MALPSIADRLCHWAATQPDKTVFTFLDDTGTVSATLTYRDVEERSRAIASRLAADPQVQRGDRVLLVFLPSLDFIVAFLACVRGGYVAVPVYPPDPRRNRAHFGAFAAITAGCGAKVALTHAAYHRLASLASLKEAATALLGKLMLRGAATTSPALAWPDLTWLPIDGWTRPPATPSALGLDASAPSAPSTIAFLQYTSGSTSEPKGVMVTHANLAHNLATIVRSLAAGTDTVVASWLPQYHDMGLIGAYLGTLYCGGSGVYLSPLSFIKSPPMWIAAMSRWGATHVQTPNFGLRLSARKWGEAAAKAGGAAAPNLRSVRHIFNAAEPIVPAAIAEFYAAFGRYGLRPDAMSPGYGLAEHTVYVSDGGATVLRARRDVFESEARVVEAAPPLRVVELEAAAPPSLSSAGVGVGGVVELVSCGPVAPYAAAPAKNADVLVLIVDAESRCVVPEGTCGEVWIHSPSVAAGYWGLPELTAETFHARLREGKLPLPPAGGYVAMAAAAAAATAPVENGGSIEDTAIRLGSGSGGESGDTTAAASSIPSTPPPAPAAVPPVDAAAIAVAAAMQAAHAGLDFLHTGDIGVIVRGELFICGRMKDLIILRGRNYFPQDVEACVEAADARIRPGCTAAFQVEAAGPSSAGRADGREASMVVVAAEVREPSISHEELEALAAALRLRVVRDHGLLLGAIVLLKPRGVCKVRGVRLG